jgi:hypothetical protein
MNPYRQDLTYWAPGANDGYGGISLGEPTSLKGRWEDRQDEYLDADRQLQLSRALVFLPQSAIEEVQVGGYLYNGSSDEEDPTVLVGAYIIRQVLITPDLRNVRNELRVMLS